MLGCQLECKLDVTKVYYVLDIKKWCTRWMYTSLDHEDLLQIKIHNYEIFKSFKRAELSSKKTKSISMSVIFGCA